MKKFIYFLILFCSQQIFGFNHIVNKAIIKNIIPRIIILAGPSGSGKGTFGEFLPKIHPKYLHIDSGAMVRKEIFAQTEVGKEMQVTYESGQYLNGTLDKAVWEKLVSKKIEETLNQNKLPIIDGFLRSKQCFDFLHKFINNKNLVSRTLLVQLIANEQTCSNRVLNRRVCTNPECSKIHNILLAEYKLLLESKDSNNTGKHNKSFTGKLCQCGAEIAIRSTDTQKFVQERRAHFDKETEPLLRLVKSYYKSVEIETECDIKELREKYNQMFSQDSTIEI